MASLRDSLISTGSLAASDATTDSAANLGYFRKASELLKFTKFPYLCDSRNTDGTWL